METARLVGDSLVRFAQAGGTLLVATHDMSLAARMAQRLPLTGRATP